MPESADDLVGYERDSARALLVTRAQSHAGPVRVFSLRTTPGSEAWSELATAGQRPDDKPDDVPAADVPAADDMPGDVPATDKPAE